MQTTYTKERWYMLVLLIYSLDAAKYAGKLSTVE